MRSKKDEIVATVLEDPDLRRRVIEAIKEDVEDALEATLVNAIKQANEKPSKWWEWLFLLVAGALAGMGLGYFLAMRSIEALPVVVGP